MGAKTYFLVFIVLNDEYDKHLCRENKVDALFSFLLFLDLFGGNEMVYIHHFEITTTSVAFHIETSHLFCSAKQNNWFLCETKQHFYVDLSFVNTIL